MNNFEVIKTPIKDLVIIQPKVFGDERNLAHGFSFPESVCCLAGMVFISLSGQGWLCGVFTAASAAKRQSSHGCPSGRRPRRSRGRRGRCRRRRSTVFFRG